MIGVEMIRLLIVEDQLDVRRGLQMRLAAETDFSVIGEATDGQAALDLTTSLRPDVVLMDVDMPRLDGIATASTLRLMCPQTSVIMLSFQDDALTRRLAEQAGAAAFVAKSMPADTLLTTIRQVAQQ
jgi:pilus assembly protein CpaE